MQINVECPFCQTKYFLQRDLIGKAMRCSTCDERFVIQEMPEVPLILDMEEEEKKTKSLPPKADTAKPIGDLIPMLEAEMVDEPVIDLEPLQPFRDPPDPPRPVPERTEPEVKIEATRPMPKAVPELSEYHDGRTVAMAPVSSRKPAPTPERTTPPAPAAAASSPAPAEVTWSSTAAPPKPREVKWNDHTAPPVQAPESPPAEPVKSDRRSRREAKRSTPRPPRSPRPIGAPRTRRKRVLVFLILFVFVGLGAVGIWFKGYLAREPERLFAKAEKEYAENRPGPAAALFETIVKDHPGFPRHKEAQFFFELSTLKSTVYSATTIGNPQPAIDQSKQFLTAIENPDLKPFAAKDKFGLDIWITLSKLADDVATKAKNDFDQDKPEETEKWIQYLEDNKGLLASYRPKDSLPENFLKEIDGLKAMVAAARVRLGALAQIDQQLQDPDDEKIATARGIARGFQLEGDPAVIQRFDEAERKLQGRIAYKRFDPPQPAKTLKDDGLTGLLFAPRIDTPNPLHRPPPAGASDVYFAVARGMLYALDETNGRVRWATRVGIDTDTVPLRIPATETQPEFVLVTVNDGLRSSITARLASNGEPIWSQPLESPALGNPVQVGNRVFVTLKDPVPRLPRSDSIGVIYEIELTNGLLLGRLSLGRPLATGGVRQQGTGLLYFPAEGKSVYVFDTLKLDENGNRLDPQLLGVLNTDHPPGTLRSEPVLSTTDPDAPGPRYLLLSQTEGLNKMKLKAFPLPQGAIPKEPVAPVEIELTGWSWFSPYCDGESLAVVTDRGEFGLFGINQIGNQDVPIFSLPPDAFKIPKADTPARGQLIHAEEGTYWILVRGNVIRVRIGLDAIEGIKVNVYGTPISVGEPIHAPQVTTRGDAFVIVTQQPDSSGCLATFIEMQTGEIRWQRQLGMMARGSPLLVGEEVFAIDQDCGLYKFDPKKLTASSDGAWLLDDSWLLAPPLKNLHVPPELFALPEGKGVVATSVEESETGPKLVVRSYQGTEMITRMFPLAGRFAGKPILFGNYLLVPLSTGTVFRINVKELRNLEEGPSWRNDRLTPDASCNLAALSDEEFLATDGNKTLLRFKWASDNPFESKAKIPWVEKIQGAIATARHNERTYFSFADAKGAVTLWDAAFPVRPLRVWRGQQGGPIPMGPIDLGPALYPGEQLRVGFVVDSRSLIWLDPGLDAPLWVSPKPAEVKSDGFIALPQLRGDRLLVADRAGWFQQLDVKTGKFIDKPVSISGNVAPSASPLQFAANAALAPVSDGTLLLIRDRKE